MMDGLKQYILSLIGSALICGIVKCFFGHKTKTKGIINLGCGLFLAITALSPVLDIDIPEISSYIVPISNMATEISQDAAEVSMWEMELIIKDEVSAYILEKASTLNMNIDVEVNLDDNRPIPCGVVIKGAVSPYDKAVLTDHILRTLDIPEENLQWME